jgi:uncharacterized protein involved in exopolysaccharide biosynthesis
MDQGLDKSKPLSPSYRETFRRHRKLFCIPMVLAALAAAFFLFGGTKTYKTTASLWVDTAPPLPSSISAANGDLAQPPASAAQAILNELLTTKAFAVSVGESSLHGKSAGSAPATRAHVARLLGQGKLVQAVPGAQVLQLSYSASSAAMAESVLAAIIEQLRSYINRSIASHHQAAVAYARDQAKAAETALATARSNVAAYQARYPQSGQQDRTYMSLVTAQKHAATQLARANTALGRVTGRSSVGSWAVKVIDPPTQAASTPLGKRKIAEVIVGGALAGLLVSFLGIVALTPTKKEEWEDELPTSRPFVPKEEWDDELLTLRPFVPAVPPAGPFRAARSGSADEE